MRLTNTKRDLILKKATESKFDSRIKESESVLAEKVEEHLLSLGEKLASEIPEGWEKYVSIGTSVNVRSQVDKYRKRVTINLKKPFCHKHGIDDVFFSNEKTFEDHLNLLSERDSFKIELGKVLYSVSTDKQLIEMIPEIEEFIPRENVSYPIVAIESVNSIRRALSGK